MRTWNNPAARILVQSNPQKFILLKWQPEQQCGGFTCAIIKVRFTCDCLPALMKLVPPRTWRVYTCNIEVPVLGRAWLLIRLWWVRESVFTSDGRLLKLLARPADRGTTWGYTRSLLIIFFRRRDFADAIRCNIKNKPSLVILFCANTSCAIWTNRWRSFLFPRVSVSLSLRRGAPPSPSLRHTVRPLP